MVRFWVCIFKVKLIMKKLLTVLALGIFALGFSQNYYDDYREVFLLLTGEMLASYLGLNGRQIAAIDVLNNRYPTYDSWDRVYRGTPGQMVQRSLWRNGAYHDACTV